MALLDFLDTYADTARLKGVNFTIGSVVPSSPQPGDMWIDTNSIWSNLWMYIGGANQWASNLIAASASFDGIWSTSAPTVLRALIPIGAASNGNPYQIAVRRLALTYCMGASSFSSTNNYSFLAYWRNASTGAFSNLNDNTSAQVSHNAQSAVANRSYHIGWNINSLVGGVGTLGCLQMDATRNGSPGGLSGVAFTAFYQMLRTS